MSADSTVGCPCECTSKGCTAGSVFAGIIVGILLTFLILRGKWNWIKIKLFNRFFQKPKAVSNAAYEPDFNFDQNACELGKKDSSPYTNVVINAGHGVEIVDTPPNEENSGQEEVYAVSLKKSMKQSGLSEDIVQKIASLHGNKIIARKSEEFEDFVDIEKKSDEHMAASRSATLPVMTKKGVSILKDDKKTSLGKNSSKVKSKKCTKTVSISEDNESNKLEEKEDLMTTKSAFVMTEASSNGDYFVLDKTFC
ncbi:uncharacterized protein LOC133187845 [Saccostrea echinata]|uniref:uncharacterized protein LOC133187845 n=1 Tax=Saccostrea echinata TaxID=191078 RepID=UPI002A81AEAD|nr:uncharacterized protein LOC133187845 [Saccostrea echinata]